MAVRLRIDAHEIRDKLGKAVEGYEERLANLEPVLKGRAQALEGMVRKDVFRGQQSPEGEPWLALKPSTVQRRRKGSAKPLIDTGNLFRSITAKATKNTVFLGVSGDAASYAVFHQRGTKHIPARPFIPDETALDRGPIGVWTDRLRRRIVKYILTGKV